MKQFTIKGFEAYTNTDLMEGKGVDKHIGFFTHENDAIIAGYKKGVMATDASVRPINRTIYVFDSIEEFSNMRVKEQINNIKSKLTPEEFDILKDHLLHAK